MAKLRVFQSIEDNNYVFLFTADQTDISSGDQQLIEKFGEPDINFGGTFTNGSGLTYTLPDERVKIVSGLPYKKVVDITTAPWSTSTSTSLALYRTTIQASWIAAITALRNLSDGFTNEYVSSI